MSEPKFTKGPWEIFGDWGIKAEGAKDCLATFENQISDKGENEGFANAHLIASAPIGFALGELVIKMCDHHEGLSPTEVGILYEAAASFVKKARGE